MEHAAAEDGLAELAAIDASHPFGPEERPMKGYVALPDAWVDQPELAALWMGRALAYVSGLPPKAKKK